MQELANHSSFAPRLRELLELPAQDVAALLLTDLGHARYDALLAGVLSRDEHALGHALLASLRIPEVVTTNFDDLYEKAAVVSFAPRMLRVLPWDRAEPGDPWLLKMHGDLTHGSTVLSRDDFLQYDARRRPLGAVVQALLLTRHMLFVGFSLSDDNFIRLARDVTALLESATSPREVGTALTLSPDPLRQALWSKDVNVVATSNSTTVSEAARALDIFLDRLLLHGTRKDSFLLDPRYRALLSIEDRKLADVLTHIGRELASQPDKGRWSELESLLLSLGWVGG